MMKMVKLTKMTTAAAYPPPRSLSEVQPPNVRRQIRGLTEHRKVAPPRQIYYEVEPRNISMEALRELPAE